MNPESENFESLRRALALKRHEVPPPGYFNNFSRKVIHQIRADQQDMTSPNALAWLLKLWQSLERKPAMAGAFGLSVCALLVAGVLYSANVGTPAVANVANNDSFGSMHTDSSIKVLQAGSQPASLGSSITPMAATTQPTSTEGSLFNQFQLQQVQPASFKFDGK